MRRKLFYLSVALLAFGIGLFSAFEFYFESYEIDVFEVENQNAHLIREDPLENEPNFEEQSAFAVLKPTIEKWLRNKKTNSGFNEVSDESIKEIIGKSRSELSEDETRFFSYFRFEPSLIDVDGDGKNELAVRNYCAPVGNCQFWIFKKNGESYEVLLQTNNNDVQTYKLENTKSKGYFDIKTTEHGDAFSGGIKVYKFDGEYYKVSECSNYNYSYLKNGKLYTLQKPKITPHECREN